MSLTQEQQKALDFTRNISVTAGAGAGKTRLLVERFLEIAIKHFAGKAYGVRKILAITFTNKAAGEMRERIAQAVQERLKITKQPEIVQHLLAIRDQLNSVSISTIHAFCARILREYPIEAGLAPDFTELDEMQAKLLINQAIEQIFEQINQEQTEDRRAQYFELFRYFEPKRVRLLLRWALQQPFEMQSIVQQFEQFETEEEFFNHISDLWLTAIHQVWDEQDLQQLCSLAHQLSTQIRPQADEKAQQKWHHLLNLKSLKEKQNWNIEDYQKIFDALAAFTTNKGTAYKRINQFGGKKSWSVEGEKTILQLSELSAHLLDRKKTFDPQAPPNQADRLYFRLFKIFLDIYHAAQQQYQSLKEEISGVDFEDLLLKTWQLLQANETIRQELVNRFEFIMVDEFQDTNALQWKIIELLSTENGVLQDKKIFVVGDPKQSIYGFRNADIRIFRNVKEQLAIHAGAPNTNAYSGNLILKNSFRFLPRLNAFINDLFNDLLQAMPQNIYEVEFEPLTAQRSVPDVGQIELALLQDEEGLSEEDYLAWTIDRLVRKEGTTCHERRGADEVERPLSFGDIAILLRSRNALLAVEQTLRRWNIPFKTVKGIGYWQQQEIYDFYHLLNFLVDPTEDFFLIALLRSKLFMLSDQLLFWLAQEKGQNFWQKLNSPWQGPFHENQKQELTRIRQLLQRWINLRDLIPLDELLRIVLEDLQYRTLITAQLNGEQLLANIEKFIEHIERFNKNGINGLLDLIEQIETLIEEDVKQGEPQINLDDRGTVKIMTIHAAKGLQFPVVFVPYLNTKNVNTVRQAVYLEPEIGLATAFRSDTVDDLQHFCLLNLLKLEKSKRELAEAKRIFYVAVTRASEHLFLSAKMKNNTIQPHSALQWMVEFAQKRGFDLLNQETTQLTGPGYQLNIVRQFDLQNQESDEIKQFFTGINFLKETLKQPPQYDEKALSPYRPLDDHPGAIVFSATRLMTYIENPHHYYQRYHLGFFESDYQLFADNIYQMDDSLVKGKIFHRFLELSTAQTLDDEELLERIFFEFEVFDPAKRQQLQEEISQLKNKIYASPQGLKILQAAQARNEVTVMMRLGNDFFTGTIDRMIQNEQGLWQVIDYKTNRISASQVAKVAEKYQWQMRGYALLLSQLYPQQTVFPVALYFVHPAQMVESVFSINEIEKIKSEFLRLIAEIKQKFPIH